MADSDMHVDKSVPSLSAISGVAGAVSSPGSCAEVNAIALGSWDEGGAGGWAAPTTSSVSCPALGRAGCPEAPALIGGIALV
jgi:hypothetical protein